MHRRKSSREEDDNVLAFPTDAPPVPTLMHPPGIIIQNGTPSSPDVSPIDGPASLPIPITNGHDHLHPSPPRSRVSSTPSVPSLNEQLPASHSHPPSAGPYRASFAIPPRPLVFNASPNGHLQPPNGHYRHHQAPAMRQSLSLPTHASSQHARTRSVSGPFSPSTPSPLGASFPPSASSPLPPKSVSPTMYRFPGPSPSSGSDVKGLAINGRPASITATNGLTPSSSSGSSAGGNPRRHARLHSRNLSIYFPRPGTLPSTSIAEDGAQELDFTPSSSMHSVGSGHSDECVSIPPGSASPGPGQRTFREGFTFGARPPASPSTNGHVAPALQPSNSNRGAARRGHHHKHSLSHQFFSFLEPGEELHTNPTPTPVSPWNPAAAFPRSPGPSAETSAHNHNHSHSHLEPTHTHSHSHSPEPHVHSHSRPTEITRPKTPIGSIRADPNINPAAASMAVLQFALGAALWVSGQQTGSLACTGLGYWVVFDSFGIALGKVVPSWLAKPSMNDRSRRPFG